MDRELDTFLKELELSGFRVSKDRYGLNGQVITLRGLAGKTVNLTDRGGGFYSVLHFDEGVGKLVERQFSLYGAIEHLTKLIRSEDG